MPLFSAVEAVNKACRIAILVLAAGYVVALFLLIVGTFGLFGQERDPLSGVFLIPLGLPWNLLIDRFAETAWPWLAAAAPAVNLGLLVVLCRFRRSG